MTKINNVPAGAWQKYYIVARYVDGEWWFYDAWERNHGADAMAQAWEIDGEIHRVSSCQVGQF